MKVKGQPKISWTWDTWRRWLIQQGCARDEEGDLLHWWYFTVGLSRGQQWRAWWADNAYRDWFRACCAKGEPPDRMLENEEIHEATLERFLNSVNQLGLLLGYRPSWREMRLYIVPDPSRVYQHWNDLEEVTRLAGIAHLPVKRGKPRKTRGSFGLTSSDPTVGPGEAFVSAFYEAPRAKVRAHKPGARWRRIA